MTLGADWARRDKGTTRVSPRTNKDANFMKGYLNTGEGRKEIATRTKPAIRSNAKWILYETAIPQGAGN